MIRGKLVQAELTIEGLSDKGQGVGYIDTDSGPQVVHVPHTLPGDRALVSLMRKRKKVVQTRLEKVLTPSPKRIQPRCRHFGLCGGVSVAAY